MTQTAKKAPIIRLQRNSSKQDIDEELRIEEPPRRSQSVGNFVRQETDENAEGNENNLSGIYGFKEFFNIFNFYSFQIKL